MDPYGEAVWIKHLCQEDSAIFNEEGYYLDVLPDSNYLVSGHCFCNGHRPMFIKADIGGHEMWNLKWPNGSGSANESILTNQQVIYSSAALNYPNKPTTATYFEV